MLHVEWVLVSYQQANGDKKVKLVNTAVKCFVVVCIVLLR